MKVAQLAKTLEKRGVVNDEGRKPFCRITMGSVTEHPFMAYYFCMYKVIIVNPQSNENLFKDCKYNNSVKDILHLSKYFVNFS